MMPIKAKKGLFLPSFAGLSAGEQIAHLRRGLEDLGRDCYADMRSRQERESPVLTRLTFTVSGADVSWTAGTIYYGGDSYSISAGTTSNAYIYFDFVAGGKVLTTNATAPTVGKTSSADIWLLCVKRESGRIEVMPFDAMIGTGAVGTAELANNAVTNAKMADDAVDTAELADYAVTRSATSQATPDPRISVDTDEVTVCSVALTCTNQTVEILAVVEVENVDGTFWRPVTYKLYRGEVQLVERREDYRDDNKRGTFVCAYSDSTPGTGAITYTLTGEGGAVGKTEVTNYFIRAMEFKR